MPGVEQDRHALAPRGNGPGAGSVLGTNQAGMRAFNERLVLTLVRRHGAVSQSDLARITGLSAQTVSVIMRALQKDGLLQRGEPLRGRIGQPSVPISLNPDGAFSVGLKIGRTSLDLALVDFVGAIRARRHQSCRWPEPARTVAFVADALPDLLAETGIAPERLAGLGVAMPFQLWDWADLLGAPAEEVDRWRDFDIAAALSQTTGSPVSVQNDATAACGAELMFGPDIPDRDFLYVFIGYFIGGGLVLDGRLRTGPTGNAAGIAPMFVPGDNGPPRRLMDVASLHVLTRGLPRAESATIFADPQGWQVGADAVAAWVDAAASALASAIRDAAALVELNAVIIDGWIPASVRDALVARTADAMARMDMAGIYPPGIRAGQIGCDARVIGAAAIPLAQRHMVELGPLMAQQSPR